jgi:nucleotide-binding universal stress UspA family protein
MQKLTSILLIAGEPGPGTAILEKTHLLARRFGARVDLLRGDSCGDELLERSPDLVVKAAGDDRQLAAVCPVPLMLMREHPWREPVRFGAAVDVSSDDAALARSIVHTAGFLNLGCEGELDVIYSERELQDEVLRMARAVKLARLLREFHVYGDRLRHVDGAPEETLPAIAASGDYDVLVLGARTHREGWSALLHPALTRQLVAAFGGDVVLVKEELPSAARLPRVPLTFRAAF